MFNLDQFHVEVAPTFYPREQNASINGWMSSVYTVIQCGMALKSRTQFPSSFTIKDDSLEESSKVGVIMYVVCMHIVSLVLP